MELDKDALELKMKMVVAEGRIKPSDGVSLKVRELELVENIGFDEGAQ